MKKTLSLLLAIMMIFSVFSFNVSADVVNPQVEAGEFLKTLGVIKGDEKGDLKAQSDLTREEALVILIRMLGKEEQSQSAGVHSGFSDVEPTHWAAKYITFGKEQGLTNGMGDGTFGLAKKVTTKQFVTFMLRALSHTADWAKEDIMQKSANLGLLKDVNALENNDIIRGDVFIIMKNALNTVVNNDTVTLIEKLGLGTPEPKPQEPQEPQEPEFLEVESVKASNLKEVEVKFNSKVDEKSLTGAFRFLGTSLGILTPELKDEKTVLVKTQHSMSNKKSYKFEVSKVKNTKDNMMEKATFEFTAEDVSVPVVEGLEVTGPKNLNLTFSEPIKTAGTVEMKSSDGKKVAANVVDFSAGDKVIKVNTANLKEGETYQVTIAGFGDYAGYVNITNEQEFTYEKMTGEPEVKIVSATQEYIELEFTRPVKNLTLGHFWHSYSSWKPVAAYKSLDSMNDSLSNKLSASQLKESRNTVVLRFVNDVQNYIQNSPAGEHPLVKGTVKVQVLGKVGSTAIVDNWGNELKSVELEAVVEGDKTVPEVLSVEATGDKEITVKFSKDITFKTNNYKVSNANGTNLGHSVKIEKDGSKAVKITINASSLAGKSVKVRIENVTDATINQNKLAQNEEHIVKFEDKSFEGMKEVLFIPGDGNSDAKIRIRFDESVDSTSALDTSNYRVKVGSNIASVGFTANLVTSDVVEFVIIKDEWKKLSTAPATDTLPAGTQISMSNNVTDAGGNKISSFEQTVTVSTSAVAPALVDGVVKAVARDKIEFEFNQEVTVDDGWDIDKFEFTGITGVKVNSVDERVANGKTKVTLTLEGTALPGDPGSVTLNYTGDKPKNSLGVAYTWASATLVDKIPPALLIMPTDASDTLYTEAAFTPDAAYTLDDVKKGSDHVRIGAYKDGADFKIELQYDEGIDASSVSSTVFETNFADVSVKSTSVSANKVTLVLSKGIKATDKNNLMIKQAGGLKDSNGIIKASSSEFIQIQEAYAAKIVE